MRNFKKTEIYLDGVDQRALRGCQHDERLSGFTTNPSLIRQVGATNYSEFCKDLASIEKRKPLSVEVLTDHVSEMLYQGMEIASWGSNINVKIPVMNTTSVFTGQAIHALSRYGVSVNVTAVMTLEQVKRAADRLVGFQDSFISIFCGRIADTGEDPMEIMSRAVEYLKDRENIKLIWASTREVFNIYQAEEVGCHIITLPESIYKKVILRGKDLEEYSRETVQMFYDDVVKAGYHIDIGNAQAIAELKRA